MNTFVRSLVCGIFAASASAAFATTITSATVYTNTPDPRNAGDSANMASTLPSADFIVGPSGINYITSGNESIAAFLNNPTFSNARNGFSSTALLNGPTATGGAGSVGTGTELVITGLLSLNNGANSLSVGHDDGVILNIAGFGNVLNVPGPTEFSDSTFSVNNPGATGTFAFTLDYAECCLAPADLVFNVNDVPVGPSPVPEPSTFVLLGTGLLSAGGVVRSRFARKA